MFADTSYIFLAKKMFDIMKKSGEIRLCEALATGKRIHGAKT